MRLVVDPAESGRSRGTGRTRGWQARDKTRYLAIVASCLSAHQQKQLLDAKLPVLQDNGIQPDHIRQPYVVTARGQYYRIQFRINSVRVDGAGCSPDDARAACLTKILALQSPPEALQSAVDDLREFIHDPLTASGDAAAGGHAGCAAGADGGGRAGEERAGGGVRGGGGEAGGGF